MLPLYSPEHLAAVKRLGRKNDPSHRDEEEEAVSAAPPPVKMYPIDYEVDSKKVRNYRTNDPNSVIGAVVEHVHELLTHHDITLYYGYENLSLVLGALMTMCAGVNFLVKGDDLSEIKWVYLVTAAVFAVLFVAQRFVAMLEGANTFAITTPSSVVVKAKKKTSAMAAIVSRVEERREWIFKRCLVQLAQPEESGEGEPVEEPDNGASMDTEPLPALTAEDSALFSELSSLFTNRATRFRIRQPVKRIPVFELQLEVLVPKSVAFFKKPHVVNSVTRLYAFSYFFDEDGFVFTPRIKEELISMLKEATNKKATNKVETTKAATKATPRGSRK